MSMTAPVRKVGARLSPLAREWGPVLFLSLLPAMPLLLGSGIVNTRAGGDSPFLLIRLQQLAVNLRDGIFPVRWMPQAAYGLGYPFFNFYASLPYYIAALLKLAGLGYLLSIKFTQALGFVLAGLAMYSLLKQLGRSKLASLIGSLTYGCAPFHLVNVYVRGDSLSEFYAFVFYPFILCSFLSLSRLRSLRPLKSTFPALAVAALSYAGLMLTHNLSAFIFTPFLLLFISLLLLKGEPGTRLRALFLAVAAMAGGLLLSAWFWIPALLERYSVSLEDMTTGYFNYAQHFRSTNLVQLRWLFDYGITAEANPFRMGLVQALLVVAGVVCIAVRWLRTRRVDFGDAYAMLLLALSTWMITPWSSRVWEKLPLLPMVQFPWRFLSVQAVAAGILASGLVSRRHPIRWTLALILGAATLASTMGSLRPEPLLIREEEVTPKRLAQYEYFTANIGTTIRADWLPSSVDPRPFISEATLSPGIRPAPLVLHGQADAIALLNSTATSETWRTSVATTDALLAFQTYYFPGWRASVDGREAPIQQLPGLGYIGLSLPEGTHQIHLWLGRTRNRLVAELASAAAVVALLALWIWIARHDPSTLRKLLAGSLVCVSWLGLALLSNSAKPSTRPLPADSAEAPVDLTMDFDRVPFLHHNLAGVAFPDAGRLVNYTASSTNIEAGSLLTVTTRWNDVTNQPAIVELDLVTPAWHLFGVPVKIAESSSPLLAGTMEHVLVVPTNINRGLYLLRLELRLNGAAIRPVDSRGETLGTTYLIPVYVDALHLDPDKDHFAAAFGDNIHLVDVEAIQRVAGQLDVRLTWSTRSSIPHNYKVALRLRDSTAHEVARLDVQPGYGFYPTSMWRPGELVWDHYLLPVDDGTPPAGNYTLDVTLYESASLTPVGTTSFPNVALTMPTVRDSLPAAPLLAPGLVLLESHLEASALRSGEKLSTWLKWGTLALLPADVHARLSLRDQGGAVVASRLAPLAEQFPTSQWPQGCVIQQHCALLLDRNLPSGTYSLIVEVLDESDTVLGSSALSETVQVSTPERNFELPPLQHSASADYGGQLRLAGYDLQHSRAEITLTLYWQSLSLMNTDYKVFVHLFDLATERIATQQDTLIGEVDHPTAQWVPDEVVTQTVRLSLNDVPAGRYTLALGVYDPQRRLPVTAPSSFTISADRLLLPQEIDQR